MLLVYIFFSFVFIPRKWGRLPYLSSPNILNPFLIYTTCTSQTTPLLWFLTKFPPTIIHYIALSFLSSFILISHSNLFFSLPFQYPYSKRTSLFSPIFPTEIPNFLKHFHSLFYSIQAHYKSSFTDITATFIFFASFSFNAQYSDPYIVAGFTTIS